MRAAVQHQREVGYVFAGSEPSLMERMLGPKRPFYKAGPVMRLEKIPADEFAAFIDARFTRSGMRPEAGLGAAIVELAGNLPYDVQRLAHETWDDVHAAPRPEPQRAARDARRSAPRAEAAALRAADDVRGGVAAADAGAARACCARSCSRRAAACCPRTSARAIGWAGRRRCRRRSPRSFATISSSATPSATPSSTRCCVSGSHARRSDRRCPWKSGRYGRLDPSGSNRSASSRGRRATTAGHVAWNTACYPLQRRDVLCAPRLVGAGHGPVGLLIRPRAIRRKVRPRRAVIHAHGAGTGQQRARRRQLLVALWPVQDRLGLALRTPLVRHRH